jgi:hypothetical protein
MGKPNARLLIAALRGVERQELTGVWLFAVKRSNELRDEYGRRGHAVQTSEELAAELKRAGTTGSSAALINGLSEQEIPSWWRPTIRKGLWR